MQQLGRAGQLAGRTAVITGGSRGIGRAIALALAAEGADIGFCHLDDDRADQTAADIAALGRKVAHCSVDLRDLDQLAAFMDEMKEVFGIPDILVNNAGGSIVMPFTALTRDTYDQVMNLNFRATVFATHAVFEDMLARGFGRIINITSQLGLRGEGAMTLYAAAKAALIGLTRSLAREGAPHGVLVNAIAPGPILTERFLAAPEDKRAAISQRLPLQRCGTPEEVGATAVLLAGLGGSFYVGACLSPNGGDVMH